VARPIARLGIVIENLSELAAVSSWYITVDTDVKVLARKIKNFVIVSRV
jgi:hypothetical protein